MTQTTTGWIIFIGAIGMMLGFLAVDVAQLKGWQEVMTPAFVGTTMGHLAAVITAFVGGKLIPKERDQAMRTRESDSAPPQVVVVNAGEKPKDQV